MQIHYPQIGICGLSCRLCPMYHTTTKSRCLGCKSQARIRVGCPFITCALKKKDIEFCWDCPENKACEKWQKHRDIGKTTDTFKCYQSLEKDIAYIQKNSVSTFQKNQHKREQLLKQMLQDFNEGRSKSYYCIAATILKPEELQKALTKATKESTGMNIKQKSQQLHSIINHIAMKKKYHLKLRKLKNKKNTC